MRTSFKKFIAGASLLALVMMNSVSVNGAAVNDATGSVDVNSFTISGADGTTFDGADSATIKVTKDGVEIDNFNSVVINQADPDTIVITKNGEFGDGYYIVTFTTDNGIFGSVTLDESATYNKVVVTATVLPILALTLVNHNSDLGELTPGVFSTTPVDLDLTYSTNAVDGMTITMESEGLKDTNADHEINAVKISALGGNDGVYTYKTATGTQAAVVANTDTAVKGSQELINTLAPISNAVTNVKLGAETTAVTPSGNYSDTLTFSITGKF